MLFIEIIIAVILIAAFIHFKLTKRKHNLNTALVTKHLNMSDEVKKTLAMGLYLRFKNEDEGDSINTNTIFIKEDPITFESFVADIFVSARGGNTWVTPPSGDFGVDFEHDVGNDRYLGQVKCEKENVGFAPIALIHSNMMKQHAKGGYVITTCSFTPAARKYAEGLNIELIDGCKLVELWLKAIKNHEEEVKLRCKTYQEKE